PDALVALPGVDAGDVQLAGGLQQHQPPVLVGAELLDPRPGRLPVGGVGQVAQLAGRGQGVEPAGAPLEPDALVALPGVDAGDVQLAGGLQQHQPPVLVRPELLDAGPDVLEVHRVGQFAQLPGRGQGVEPAGAPLEPDALVALPGVHPRYVQLPGLL